MKNPRISWELWADLVSKTPMVSVPPIGPIDGCHYFLGFPLIRVDDGFILFERCEYCDTHDNPKRGLFGNYICHNCGAPVG